MLRLKYEEMGQGAGKIKLSTVTVTLHIVLAKALRVHVNQRWCVRASWYSAVSTAGFASRVAITAVTNKCHKDHNFFHSQLLNKTIPPKCN